MDPKKLAKLYQQKQDATDAEAAKGKARVEKQQEAFRKRVDQGRAAMRDVVIPYFNELVAAFPKGQFKFGPETMDAQTHEPLAVAFKIGNGAKHVIEVIQGHVRIYKQGFRDIQFVYAGTAEPHIAEPSDLIREKLDKLVEMAIKGT